MVSLSCAVMHSAFSIDRRKSVELLVQDIGAELIAEHWVDFQIFGDFHRRGAWWNAKRCWKWGSSLGTSHHMLLQDDILVCRDFASGVLRVIEAFPKDVINLFHGPRKAFDGSGRWGISEGVWGQGIILPSALLRDFLLWEKEHIKPEFPHDDSRVSLFCVRNKIRPRIPFPTLIDHKQIKSILGHSWKAPRVSNDFLGDRSPHEVNWSERTEMKSINSFTQYNKFLK